jgi:hypothetical protein
VNILVRRIKKILNFDLNERSREVSVKQDSIEAGKGEVSSEGREVGQEDQKA